MDLFELVVDRDAAARAVLNQPGMRIWQFNGIYPHEVTIDALVSRLSILEVIDQYAGSAPELFSLGRYIASRVELEVNRALLLDSNVSRYMRKYIGGDLNEKIKKDVHELLTWAVTQHVNFHPGFSLMETFSGSSDPELHGRELIKMGLLLSGMDGELFLRDARVALGDTGKAFLQANFGTDDLERAADLEMSRLPRDMQRTVDATYASLLKIALIEDTVSFSQFGSRIEAFWDFLTQELNAVLVPELCTALLFFSGYLGRFIPLRTARPIEDRLAQVRSSAWDLHLLRLPAAFVGQGDEKQLTLPLIVTGDERLKKIARSHQMVGVICYDKGPPFPIVQIDFPYVESYVPKSWSLIWLQDRMQQRVVPENRAPVDLQALIAVLEDQVRDRFAPLK